MLCPRLITDPAADCNGYFPFRLLFIDSYQFQYFRDFHIIIHFLFQLFSGKSKMSASLRTFDHYKIRISMIFFLPVFQDQCRRTGTGDDRCNCNVCIRNHCRKLQRQPGAGHNKICAGLNGLSYIGLIMIHCHHDIKPEDSIRCNLSRLLQFFLHCLQIC